jgi:very-short-patch-repair endonuclease
MDIYVAIQNIKNDLKNTHYMINTMMKKPIPFERQFASYEKSKYWSDKNKLKPHEVYKSAAKKYWFNCGTCNHEFESRLDSITKGGWCPYCSNPPKKICGNCKACYEKSFHSHEKSEYWGNSNVMNPEDVFMKSDKKYWFKCELCPHEFKSALNGITMMNNWCPYCSNSKLCKGECSMCFDKSFASHEKSKYWSVKNKLTPREVFLNSHKKLWFKCDGCPHEFESRIYDITTNKKWCPYCANKKLCTNECDYCFNKSCASHYRAKDWCITNKLIPRDVFKGSDKNIWFKCDKCPHRFERQINGVIKYDYWCPFCSHRRLCKDNCSMCFNNSFASSNKAKYWSSKNKITPRDVFISAAGKYWFKCAQQHEFNSIISGITAGSWCPQCINKTEAKLLEFLKPLYPNIIHQFKVEWCKNKQCRPFDFCISKYKLIIEMDGLQHFQQVSTWKSPEKQHEIDIFKEKCANNNDHSVIRIPQEYICYDQYEWYNSIIREIEFVGNNQTTIHNIYINDNNEYKKFLDNYIE